MSLILTSERHPPKEIGRARPFLTVTLTSLPNYTLCMHRRNISETENFCYSSSLFYSVSKRNKYNSYLKRRLCLNGMSMKLFADTQQFQVKIKSFEWCLALKIHRVLVCIRPARAANWLRAVTSVHYDLRRCVELARLFVRLGRPTQMGRPSQMGHPAALHTQFALRP